MKLSLLKLFTGLTLSTLLIVLSGLALNGTLSLGRSAGTAMAAPVFPAQLTPPEPQQGPPPPGSSSAIGYLSGPSAGDPLDIALEYLRQHMKELGLTPEDLADIVVKDHYISKHNGITHIYIRQRLAGIEVFNGDININITADGRVLNMGNRFVPDLSNRVDTTTPTLTAIEAANAAVQHLGLTLTEPLMTRQNIGGPSQEVLLSEGGVSLEEIPAKLMFQPDEGGKVRLAWNVGIRLVNGLNWWQLRVDATSGELLEQNDWIANDIYHVFAVPKESPSDGGQTDVTNPADAVASPFGWHDTNGAAGAEFTDTRGNNVSAQEDTDANNSGGARPSGGGTLNFPFTANLAQQPSTYQDAAITNLFYWNNIIHDITYQYGFDEPAGNFQENNYTNTGAEGDPVQADAQDGSGTNNANFGTPPDGSDPRMQMFRWNLTTPERDSDLDNGVIAHEYGHGISNRLTGGPANTSCLSNAEQMGEGWSDWLGLVLTAVPGDTGATKRGIGTYVLGEPPTGDGIRDFPYSTNMAIDPRTYDEIKTASIPHGVGSTWAAMIWEMYWALVDQYGFDSDLYDGNGGNNLAIQLVMDGMKLQPCSPGFVDGRNAILQADLANNGGANQCLIWGAFAKRGLGFSASQGSSGSRSDGTEAFDLPPSCTLLNAIPASQNICVGSNAVYTVTVGAGFSSPVTMNLTGKPAGTSHTFTPNPVIGPYPKTSKLTIGNTAGATAGSYNLQISGNATGTTSVELNVFDGPPTGGITLSAPPNNSASQSTQPDFTWNSSDTSVQNYKLEVATDAGFTNIVYSAVVTGTSHTPTTELAGNTKHYWRVIPQNTCGAGNSSPVFNFTTAILFCRAPSVPILDTPGNKVLTDTLVVSDTGEILDMNVFIDAAHTWVGDLSFALKHVDTGTSVTLINRPGVPSSTHGCSNDSINATLDDEAGAPVEDQCAPTVPTINGAFSPNQALTAFDGEDLSGDWQLIVTDDFNGDTGILSEWCLAPQTAGLPPEPPVIVVNKATLASTQAANTNITKTFTIRNGGQETLQWKVDDQGASFSGVPAVEVEAGGAVTKQLGPVTPPDPTQKPPPTSLLEVVDDGSFEQGAPNPDWSENSSNGAPLICDVPGCGAGGGSGPRSGSYWVWLGGLSVDEEGTVAQTVTIPTGTATLRFYLEMPACNDPDDYMEVLIDGVRVFIIKGNDTALCDKTGYKLRTVNVSQFADGGPHILEFHSETFGGGGDVTNFFIDDVSLSNSRCEPNNIPWATVSPASGSNISGVTKSVKVRFNSNGLSSGTYNGTLCIDSNDPNNNPVLLPVKLTVQSTQQKLYLPVISKKK